MAMFMMVNALRMFETTDIEIGANMKIRFCAKGKGIESGFRVLRLTSTNVLQR